MPVEGFLAPVSGGSLAGWVGGEGAPVLALHGGPGLSCHYLDDMVAELRGGYLVATYQQRGLQPSTLEGPFSVEQEVADACSVLDVLGWARAWVVGHSWGAHLLLHLAVASPDRLLGGLAVDTLGTVGDGGAGAMEKRFADWVAVTSPDPASSDDDRDSADTGPVARLRRVWPAYFASPEDAPPMPDLELSPRAYEGVFDSIRRDLPALAARLPDVTLPLGFLAGALSPLPPRDSSAPTSAVMPGSWLEIVEGAGHFPWVEVPGCVRSALDRLVTEGSTRSRSVGRDRGRADEDRP